MTHIEEIDQNPQGMRGGKEAIPARKKRLFAAQFQFFGKIAAGPLTNAAAFAIIISVA